MLTLKDLRSNQDLKLEGFTPSDIKVFTASYGRYFTLSEDMDDAVKVKDFEKVAEIEGEIEVLESLLLYMGKDPREVPKEILLRNLHTYEGADNAIKTYRARIRNPASAIRAYCVWCMGGSAKDVRFCAAANCPLWTMRMGSNPFHGKTLPPAEALPDIVLPDDDDIIVEEDTDEGDAEDKE